MDRRRLLKILGLGAAGVAFGVPLPAPSPARPALPENLLDPFLGHRGLQVIGDDEFSEYVRAMRENLLQIMRGFDK